MLLNTGSRVQGKDSPSAARTGTGVRRRRAGRGARRRRRRGAQPRRGAAAQPLPAAAAAHRAAATRRTTAVSHIPFKLYPLTIFSEGAEFKEPADYTHTMNTQAQNNCLRVTQIIVLYENRLVA